MDQSQNQEYEHNSTLKQLLVMIGITFGCILAAWLLVEALEYLI